MQQKSVENSGGGHLDNPSQKQDDNIKQDIMGLC
jgi:hypothetical protein